jgi:hypothetical protein
MCNTTVCNDLHPFHDIEAMLRVEVGVARVGNIVGDGSTGTLREKKERKKRRKKKKV